MGGCQNGGCIRCGVVVGTVIKRLSFGELWCLGIP